jgi:aldose 1-epimerase
MARVELIALLCLAGTLGAQATAGPGPDARVGVYELKLGDFSVKVTNWGARLMSVVLPAVLSIPASCCRLCNCPRSPHRLN